MSLPRLAIALDDFAHAYQPGDVLRGECRVDAATPHDLRALELSVLWFTVGQGEEDLGVHYFHRVAAEEQSPQAVAAGLRFETALPASPLSYDGILVKVCWCVRARLFLARDKDVVVEKPFRLGSVARSNPIQTSSL